MCAGCKGVCRNDRVSAVCCGIGLVHRNGAKAMSRGLRDLLRAETDRLKDAGLYKREVVFARSGGMVAGGTIDGKLGEQVINFTTYDFLGLSADPQVQEAAIKAASRYGVGVSSQRMMC